MAWSCRASAQSHRRPPQFRKPTKAPVEGEEQRRKHMQRGRVVLSRMEEVLYGRPAGEAVAELVQASRPSGSS